jgi:hypothetical protein
VVGLHFSFDPFVVVVGGNVFEVVIFDDVFLPTVIKDLT